jgi:exopolysaccharide biosynthesis polyprenyl glycosylphosphotransferase
MRSDRLHRPSELKSGSKGPLKLSPASIDAAVDFVAVICAFLLTFGLYRLFDPGAAAPINLRLVIQLGFVHALISVVLLARANQYRRWATILNLRLQEQAVYILGTAGTILLSALFALGIAPARIPSFPVIGVLLSIPTVLVLRRISWAIAGLLRRPRRRRLLICGAGPTGRLLSKKVMQSPRYRAQVVGFVDERLEVGAQVGSWLDSFTGRNETVHVLARPRDLALVVESHEIDEILITEDSGVGEYVGDLVRICQQIDIDFGVLPRPGDLRTDQLRVDDISALTVLRPDWIRQSRLYLAEKRLLDLTLTALIVPFALPVVLLAALAIKLDTGGPSLFRQVRVGAFGREFTIYKLRTLSSDARPYDNSPTDGRDPRVTRVGRWLRDLGIDELPQLWNVLRGEMSLVGPRPDMPFLIEGYSDTQLLRLQAKPGITGLWQLSSDRSREIHDNIEYDLYYLKHRSLLLDVLILTETAVFSASAAFAAIIPRKPTTADAHPSGDHEKQAPPDGQVLVALDQRCRNGEPESWQRYIPEVITSAGAHEVRCLIAEPNRTRYEELLSQHRAPERQAVDISYVPYSNNRSARAAVLSASLVVTDMPHVAEWAEELDIPVVDLLTGSEKRGQARGFDRAQPGTFPE